jgi:hypothetical protein
MTIISKPATDADRANYDATFGKKRALPKNHAELAPICKFNSGGRCLGLKAVCGVPCPAFGDDRDVANFVKAG